MVQRAERTQVFGVDAVKPIKQQVCLLRSFARVRNHGLGLFVDLRHHGDLVGAFRVVHLIDANRINPNLPLRFILSQALKGSLTVACDIDDAVTGRTQQALCLIRISKFICPCL